MNLLGNTLATQQAALLQHDNQYAALLQHDNLPALIQEDRHPWACDWDNWDKASVEGKTWANDVITGAYKEGYTNPAVEESAGRGETPELDERDPEDRACPRVIGKPGKELVFTRGIKPAPGAQKDGKLCQEWLQFFQTDPCGLKPKACRATRRGNIKISREKVGGFLWHAGGYRCKDWAWSHVFWKPRIPISEFIRLNIPATDGPSIAEK